MKTSISIGSAYYNGEDWDELVDYTVEAEKLGVDQVWSAEAWGMDAIVPLAYIAAKTEKIKLGTDQDIEIVRALRDHTDAKFRIDANTAWTASQTIENSLALQELGVEFLEQPLPAEDWDGMREVFAHSALPVIADESCVIESDVDRCAGFFHGVNIKLTKCGGMTPGRRMILHAKELGMQYVKEYFSTVVEHYEIGGKHFKEAKGYEYYGNAAEAIAAMGLDAMAEMYAGVNTFGTPEQIIEQLHGQKEILGCDHNVLVIPKYGSMSQQEAIDSTSLFA